MPFGELPHGGEGILEYYRELFKVDSDHAVLGFLAILADDNYRGHIRCPCGSNIKLRNCHGKLLLELKGFEKQRDFLIEWLSITNFMREKGQDIPKALIPKAIFNKARIA